MSVVFIFTEVQIKQEDSSESSFAFRSQFRLNGFNTHKLHAASNKKKKKEI